eukprot:scaffold107226_cov45-Phaeocystis_antarctica.AAC.1
MRVHRGMRPPAPCRRPASAPAQGQARPAPAPALASCCPPRWPGGHLPSRGAPGHDPSGCRPHRPRRPRPPRQSRRRCPRPTCRGR